jgi:hypothetical protein
MDGFSRYGSAEGQVWARRSRYSGHGGGEVRPRRTCSLANGGGAGQFTASGRAGQVTEGGAGHGATWRCKGGRELHGVTVRCAAERGAPMRYAELNCGWELHG